MGFGGILSLPQTDFGWLLLYPNRLAATGSLTADLMCQVSLNQAVIIHSTSSYTTGAWVSSPILSMLRLRLSISYLNYMQATSFSIQ